MERIKALSGHLEKIKEIQDIIANDKANIFEKDWSYFTSLLDTLYENVDNPEHLNELY